jgi:hypothetical protein
MWKIGGYRITSEAESLHCPNCRGHRIRRSRRSGVFEKTLLKALGVHPYRCKECDERYFGVRLRHEQPEARPSETPHAFKG